MDDIKAYQKGINDAINEAINQLSQYLQNGSIEFISINLKGIEKQIRKETSRIEKQTINIANIRSIKRNINKIECCIAMQNSMISHGDIPPDTYKAVIKEAFNTINKIFTN